MELLFPIKDEPSAWLMEIKADCLTKAGVIGESERLWVRDAARAMHRQDTEAA